MVVLLLDRLRFCDFSHFPYPFFLNSMIHVFDQIGVIHLTRDLDTCFLSFSLDLVYLIGNLWFFPVFIGERPDPSFLVSRQFTVRCGF